MTSALTDFKDAQQLVDQAPGDLGTGLCLALNPTDVGLLLHSELSTHGSDTAVVDMADTRQAGAQQPVASCCATQKDLVDQDRREPCLNTSVSPSSKGTNAI